MNESVTLLLRVVRQEDGPFVAQAVRSSGQWLLAADQDLAFALVVSLAPLPLDAPTVALPVSSLAPIDAPAWREAQVAARAEPFFDIEARQVCADGERQDLTPLEFGVLHLLWQRRGRAVSRADLIAEVWGFRTEAISNVVDVVVRSLRRKMGSGASLLETVRGYGYRLSTTFPATPALDVGAGVASPVLR